MRVPAGARRNGGHNIEMTDVTGCFQMTCIIDFISSISSSGSTVVDSTLSLVDFYNETALRARITEMLLPARPSISLFSVISRRKVKINAILHGFFTLVNCSIRLAYKALSLRPFQLKWDRLTCEVESTSKSIRGGLETSIKTDLVSALQN